MSTPAWWQRIGGPNAITAWSWWITLPLALLISLSGAREIGAPLGPWLALVLAVQIALIAPLVIIRATYLSARPRPSRPAIAVFTFAALGALRQAALAAIAWAMGYDAAADLIGPWTLTGAIYGAVALSIIAIVVDSARDHATTMQRLRDLQASLDDVTRMETDRLAELEAQFLADAEAAVMAALDEVRRTAAPSTVQASLALRRVAEAVVRPLSHRLADDDAWGPPAAASVPAGTPRGRTVSVLSALQPVAPLGAVLLLEGAGLPFMLTRLGLLPALLNLLVGGIVLYLATALVHRRAPRLGGGARRVMSLASAYVTCAALACAAVFACFTALGWPTAFLMSVLVVYPLLALALSTSSAIEAQRRAMEDDAAVLVVRQAQAIDRLRIRVAAARRRIAHSLHSSVQAEIIAAALSLARTRDESTTAAGAIDSLAERVSAALRSPASDAPRSGSVRNRLDELAQLWDGVLDVNFAYSDEVWAGVDGNATLEGAVVDVVAEALTNAVRHGGSSWARVVLSPTDSGFAVDVTAGGRLGGTTRPGLGTRTIAEASSRWDLANDGDGVRLHVEFDRKPPYRSRSTTTGA